MAKIKNPLTVVKGGGTPAVLVEKTITQNGDYSGATETPPVDGFDAVHVNVQGETVYVSKRGVLYTEKVTIPDDPTINTTDLTTQAYRYCPYLREFTCLSQTMVIAAQNCLGDNQQLHHVKFPYITEISGSILTMYNASGEDYKTLEIGSIGHPVSRIVSNSFVAGGQNWTATIYVNATTFAEIPANVIGNSPWGATNLQNIIYRNSTTGEVITA